MPAMDDAMAAHGQGRLAEAARLYAEALAADPGNATGWVNRAAALHQLGRLPEALADLERALALQPDNAVILFRRAGLLQQMLRYDEALAGYDRVLAMAPQAAEVWNNRGHVLQQLARFGEALESFRRAEAIGPAPPARLNQALLHLLQGDFALGLALYEARKELGLEARSYPQPLWTGAQDIAGKTLFAYVEQGLGDAIQYLRYAALARARGAAVIVAVPDSLVALLSRATPAVTVIGHGQTPPPFDFHIPLASIPLAVGMATPVSPGRYLSADPARVAAWKEKLGDHGRRIAIAWQGKEVMIGQEGKSFPLATLGAIAAIPGVRLISVQKGPGESQLDHLPPGMTVERYAFDSGPDAFVDTAAILECCDLAIMADTGPAHLAGALARPTWLALKTVPDWRWFMGRADTPWYDGMRLFRQPATGDWASVFREMALALRP